MRRAAISAGRCSTARMVTAALAQIREALPPSATFVAGVVPYLADRAGVLESVRVVLEHADRRKPCAQGALTIAGRYSVTNHENKLWSPEHSGQTASYWRWLARQPVLAGGLFLSPAGDPPLTPGFKAVSYMDLLGCLLEGPAAGAALVAQEELVLASYLKTLAHHVLRTELRVVRALGRST